MEIKGKVHCLFEQSGTFKNEFKKLGYDAFDYDIQNHFNETDYVVDLFENIENAYDNKPSIFDNITIDDLILAFFPCIYFCDAKTLFFKGVHISQKKWSLKKKMDFNIDQEKIRNRYFVIFMKLFSIVDGSNLRMIVENPYNQSGMTFLENNFINPTIIDRNRMLRGDFFIKPTGYWFVNCIRTYGESFQKDKKQRVVMKMKKGNSKVGLCSEERSMISPDYARNFICDFIIGKEQINSEQDLFK